jgi:sterol desaturase/sphingolipid hydroxylase (fatty acid hydroxylase superfamily)
MTCDLPSASDLTQAERQDAAKSGGWLMPLVSAFPCRAWKPTFALCAPLIVTRRYQVSHQAELIVVAIAALGLLMMIVERLLPGRGFPIVEGWLVRAISINGCQVLAILLAGVGWNGWMVQHRPWSADHWGTAAGALTGYVVLTFVYYWWHLWRHRSDFLWRWLHQIHHSPQRLELLTAFYKHPLEIVTDSLLSSAILYLAIGLGPKAAAGAMTLSGIGELFYHWNVKTPYWLGFVVQRPESHLIHHEEGLHDYNYSDLPIWDILFGTFRNPHEWNERCGFGSSQEQMVIEMLHGIDASKSAPKRSVNVQPQPLASRPPRKAFGRIARRFHQKRAEPQAARACGAGGQQL